jgi:hypothetical protein
MAGMRESAKERISASVTAQTQPPTLRQRNRPLEAPACRRPVAQQEGRHARLVGHERDLRRIAALVRTLQRRLDQALERGDETVAIACAGRLVRREPWREGI